MEKEGSTKGKMDGRRYLKPWYDRYKRLKGSANDKGGEKDCYGRRGPLGAIEPVRRKKTLNYTCIFTKISQSLEHYTMHGTKHGERNKYSISLLTSRGGGLTSGYSCTVVFRVQSLSLIHI